MAYGVVDVEYKRVPCQYPGSNLQLKVHERSRYPEYLALVILFQAGQKEITAVELWQEEHQKWMPMHRAYGAIWDTHLTLVALQQVAAKRILEGEQWLMEEGVMLESLQKGKVPSSKPSCNTHIPSSHCLLVSEMNFAGGQVSTLPPAVPGVIGDIGADYTNKETTKQGSISTT